MPPPVPRRADLPSDISVMVIAIVKETLPASATVTWTSPKGDGGGCNFPVTYHPHTSMGPTNQWAVWLGFGGPFSGKCVVTITLAP